jgi:hypothetical protein
VVEGGFDIAPCGQTALAKSEIVSQGLARKDGTPNYRKMRRD